MILNILLVLAGILSLVWILGLIFSFTFGGGVYILLAIALILTICWFFIPKKY